MTLFDNINIIHTKYPTLNSDGFVVPSEPNNTQEYKKAISKNHDDLINQIDDIRFVSEWLKDIDKTRGINTSFGSSYSIKRLLEPYSPKKHISNGAFIAGAVIAGFKLIKAFDVQRSNAYFNMSQKSVKKKLSL
jgi:hypothetical protein